jgi:hypothetical protein
MASPAASLVQLFLSSSERNRLLKRWAFTHGIGVPQRGGEGSRVRVVASERERVKLPQRGGNFR